MNNVKLLLFFWILQSTVLLQRVYSDCDDCDISASTIIVPVGCYPETWDTYLHPRTNSIEFDNLYGHVYYNFTLTQISGDLNIENLQMYQPGIDDGFAYISDNIFYSNQAVWGSMSVYFEIPEEDLHPADQALIEYKWRCGNIDDWGDWHTHTFIIRPEQPTITGSGPVCYSGSKTFTISNIPDNVSSLSFDVSSNLQIVGYTSTSVTVRAKYSYSQGEGWIRPKYNMDCNHTLNCAKKYVWAGKPDVPEILGDDELNRFDFAWYFLDSESKRWGDFNWSASGHFSIKSITNGQKLQVQAIQPGFGWIYCDVSNACGTTPGQKLVEISSGRGLMINPNPADTYLVIDIYEEEMNVSELNPEDNYVLRMFDKTGMIRYTDQIKEFPYRINTSNLSEGLYIIQLIYEGENFSIQVVIEH